ncbi:MAG: PDZ domain-containing protein [Armatimonadia bacterium]
MRPSIHRSFCSVVLTVAAISLLFVLGNAPARAEGDTGIVHVRTTITVPARSPFTLAPFPYLKLGYRPDSLTVKDGNRVLERRGPGAVKIPRSWLGVRLADLDAATRGKLGVPKGGILVDMIIDGAPAADLLQPNDVIMSVGGKAVRQIAEVIDAIRARPPHTKLEIEVVRNKQRCSVVVELGEEPAGSNNEELEPYTFSLTPLHIMKFHQAQAKRKLQVEFDYQTQTLAINAGEDTAVAAENLLKRVGDKTVRGAELEALLSEIRKERATVAELEKQLGCTRLMRISTEREVEDTCWFDGQYLRWAVTLTVQVTIVDIATGEELLDESMTDSFTVGKGRSLNGFTRDHVASCLASLLGI